MKIENRKRNTRRFRCYFVFLFSFCLFPACASAVALSHIRDLINYSQPSFASDHEITFTATRAIPPSGRIIITPEDGDFLIPVAFDFASADLSVATSSGGNFTDRLLAAVPSASEDGVSVVTGYSGSVAFTLNSGAGINAGEIVKIELGDNATYSGNGTHHVYNPDVVGSYRINIETKDAANVRIDNGNTMIVIIAPVAVGPIDTRDMSAPVLYSGIPSGILPGETHAVELAVWTDEYSTCRFSDQPGIPFASATGTFPILRKNILATTTDYTHSGSTVSGLQNSTVYSYYVRCRDYQGNTNTSDYVISFTVGIVGSGGTSGTGSGGTTGNGTGTGGSDSSRPGTGSGGGSGGLGLFGPAGGGDFLGTSDVIVTGTAYPQAKVSVMKDGKAASTVVTGNDGVFSVTLSALERGTYTFSAYAIDSKGARSSIISSTVTLIASTLNSVSRMFIPPTVRADERTVAPGGVLAVSGEGMLGSLTEVSMIREDESQEIVGVATSSVNAKGQWTATFNTNGYAVGTYSAVARSLLSGGDSSAFSQKLPIGIGKEAPPDLSSRADLNRDGKVDLIDFSILLFAWGTDDGTADINLDGTVDLTDFSIMIFYWTG